MAIEQGLMRVLKVRGGPMRKGAVSEGQLVKFIFSRLVTVPVLEIMEKYCNAHI